VKDARERQQALIALVQHGGFRKAHPRAEHFVPLYVAAGAADRGQDSGEAEVLMGAHGCKTILFR
jgi:aromatic ring-opening dioxygenase catalytic subunit (LigB family)